MIQFHAEIAFYSQLKRIDSAFMDALVSRIDTILRDANAQPVSRHMPLQYTFDDSTPGAHLQAAQASFAAYQLLSGAADRLAGFNIALEGYGEVPADDATRAFKALLLRDDRGCRLLIGDALVGDFAQFFTIKCGRGLNWVEDFRFVHPVSTDSTQDFWTSPTLLRSFSQAAAPWMAGEGNGHGLVLVAPSKIPVMRTVEKALSEASILQGIPRFRAFPSLANPLASLATGITEAALAPCEGRLCAAERAVFERGKASWRYLRMVPFKASLPPEILRSFASFLELFLSGYSRDRAAKGMPAPILLEGLDAFSPEAAETLSSAMGRFPLGGGPFIIATSSKVPGQSAVDFALDVAELPETPPEEEKDYAERHFPSLAGTETLGTILERWGGTGLPCYLALVAGKSSHDPVLSYLRQLPDDMLEFLYLTCLSSGILDAAALADFLSSTGRQAQAQEMSFRQLYQMGLVLGPDRPEPSLDLLADKAAAALGEKAKEMKRQFALRLLQLSSGQSVAPSLDLMAAASAAGAVPGLPNLERAILFERSTGNLAPALAASSLEPIAERDGETAKELPCLKAWATFLEASERGGGKEILARERAMEAVHPAEGCAMAGHRELARSFAAHMAREDKLSLEEAKRALMAFQSSPLPSEAACADRALGLHFLRQEQVFDAMDYFENALQEAESAQDSFGAAISTYFTAVSFFLYGNASRALRLSSKAAEWAQASFRPDWESQALLLRGRVEYDLGRYEAARSAWNEGRCAALLSGLEPAAKRFEILIGRSFAAGGPTETALGILAGHQDDPEAALFRSEALLAGGRAREALDEADRALRLSRDAEYVYAESPRFDCATALIEDLCFGKAVNERAFHLSALCARSSASMALGKVEEAASDLGLLTHGPGISDLDPSVMRYWQLAYLFHSQGNTIGSDLQADRATLLSKAFKHLQLRASRIDTAEDKQAYMTENAMNRRLLEEAKKYKFI